MLVFHDGYVAASQDVSYDGGFVTNNNDDRCRLRRQHRIDGVRRHGKAIDNGRHFVGGPHAARLACR